jgi:hypothetical protein
MIKNIGIIERISLFFIFCFISCEYNPSGSYHKDISIQVPQVHVTLNNNSDTIAVCQTAYFEYSVDIGACKLYKINFYLDDEIIYTSREKATSIPFLSRNYEDGIYTLTMEIITGSGTGSLADNLGEEVFIFYKNWVVLIYNGPPTPVEIKNIQFVNGRLEITWQKYDKPNFWRYNLYRGSITRYGYFSSKMITHFIDQNITSCIDWGYIGGDITYRVDVNALGIVAEGIPMDFSFRKTEIIGYEILDSIKVRLIWSKCPVPLNFYKYTLEKHSRPDIIGGLISYEEFYTSTDTTWIDNDVNNGDTYYYRIITYSDASDYSHDSFSDYYAVTINN